MVEKYVIYDVDMHEKLAETISQEVVMGVIEILFDRMICDNLQVQRIRVEGEEVEADE